MKDNKKWVIIGGNVTNACCTSQENNGVVIQSIIFSDDTEIKEDIEEIVDDILYETFDNVDLEKCNKEYLEEVYNKVLENRKIIIRTCLQKTCFYFYYIKRESDDNRNLNIQYDEKYDFMLDENRLFG